MSATRLLRRCKCVLRVHFLQAKAVSEESSLRLEPRIIVHGDGFYKHCARVMEVRVLCLMLTGGTYSTRIYTHQLLPFSLSPSSPPPSPLSLSSSPIVHYRPVKCGSWMVRGRPRLNLS